MFSIALLVSALVADAAPRSVTWAEVDKKSPPQLSRMFLPPNAAANVIDGKLGRIWLPGQSFGLSLWTAARPAGPMLCHRVLHSLDLKNMKVDWAEVTPPDTALTVGEVRSLDQYATTYPRPATRETCAVRLGYISPPENRREMALQAVRRLVWAIDKARGSGRLPFGVTCEEDEDQGARCTQSRAALAQLPLSTMFGVEFDTGRYAQIPGMSPGIIRQVPATKEFPAVPTVRFGPSGDDGLSWFASLDVKDGRLTAVRLRRSMVIYH